MFKTIIAIIFLILFFVPLSWGQVAIPDQTALSVAPAENDLVPMYDTGSAAGKKITILNFFRALEAARTSYEIHADNLPDLSSIYQPIDTDLTALAALTTTAYGRALLEVADQAALKAILDFETSDSPQFTGIELGHATDTTIARSGAGDIMVEGNHVYRAGGTDVADGDVANDITITSISQVADVSTTALEINRPLDGALVELAEFQQLETIGATTISAGQWVFVGSQDQATYTTSAVTFATVNTGQGAHELYAMDQNLQTTDAPTFATLNTGPGAYELYAMNQDVETTDAPTFAGQTLTDDLILDDGTLDSPAFIFRDQANEAFSYYKSNGGNMNVSTNTATDRNVDITNSGAGYTNLEVDGHIKAGVRTSAPSAPAARDEEWADCDTWNPAGINCTTYSNADYKVIYDGASWVAQYNEDGVLFASSLQVASITLNVVAVTSTPHTVTDAQARGGWLVVTAAGDVDLPDCEAANVGMNLCVEQGDASEVVSVAVGEATDDILLSGTLIGANNELDSPGGAGDRGAYVCLICTEDDLWRAKGREGTWVDGGTVD